MRRRKFICTVCHAEHGTAYGVDICEMSHLREQAIKESKNALMEAEHALQSLKERVQVRDATPPDVAPPMTKKQIAAARADLIALWQDTADG